MTLLVRAFPALLALLLGAPTLAAPDGRPRRIDFIGDLHDHDPTAPTSGYESWDPVDLVNLLNGHPGLVLRLGRFDGTPPGNALWERRRAQIAEVERLAALAGVPTAQRTCVPVRMDLRRFWESDARFCDPARGGRGCDFEGDMDGSFGEPETVVKVRGRVGSAAESSLRDGAARWTPNQWAHRLLVVRPGSALEERRRIVGNDAEQIQLAEAFADVPGPGELYEIRGSFDRDWILRVPIETHEASVERFWERRRNVCGRSLQADCRTPAEPLDPFSPLNRRGWVSGMDRAGVEALRTASTVPALAGSIADGTPMSPEYTDPYFAAHAVVMDVRNPAYRHWNVRKSLYKLQDFGYEPGEPVCIVAVIKPAAHTYYDETTEGPSTHPCAIPGTFSWQGPAHVCPAEGNEGGLMNPTQFKPGEYEAAVNEWLRELLATLPQYGYSDFVLLTEEKPAYRNRKWDFLAEDIRFHPRVVGSIGSPLDPPLAALTDVVGPLLAGSPPAPVPPTPPATPSSPPQPTPTPPPPPTAGPGAPAPQPGPASGTGGSWSLGSGRRSSETPMSVDRIRSGGGSGGGVVEAPGGAR